MCSFAPTLRPLSCFLCKCQSFAVSSGFALVHFKPQTGSMRVPRCHKCDVKKHMELPFLPPVATQTNESPPMTGHLIGAQQKVTLEQPTPATMPGFSCAFSHAWPSAAIIGTSELSHQQRRDFTVQQSPCIFPAVVPATIY